MGFSQTIINLFYNSATGSKKYRTLMTPVGATVFVAFFVITILVSQRMDNILNLPDLFACQVSLYAGILASLLGLFFIIWSIYHFLRVKGTPVPLNPPPVLVDNGPYAYTRNPMLTGVFLFYFGTGFCINSVSMVFILTPLFIFLNVLELKYIEEVELEKRLGQNYIEYKKTTPMFFTKPFTGKKST